MAVTLIINPGSSSKKYTLVRDGATVATFRFERNEQTYEVCREHNGAEQLCEGVTLEVYQTALAYVLATATSEGVITASTDVATVGIRIVAPGSYFAQHRLVDEVYLAKLEAARDIAPLHIPHTLTELRELRKILPTTTVVGVSDSAFHATVPALASTIPIDAHDASDFDIKRFGYHGISYASLVRSIPRVMGTLPARVIACHIGSGMSMTALKDGVSIDTTMGFGPGSGLMMGARVGDIEPAALLELMRVKHMKPVDAHIYLQSRGGFVGQTGESDFRHLLARYSKGDEAAVNAFALCRYHIQKTIGAFMVALGGLDAIVLTATAVERSPLLRSILLQDLAWLGIELDEQINDETMSRDGIVSKKGSKVPVVVIRANEFAELLTVTESFTSETTSAS
jgi:acetate kinase